MINFNIGFYYRGWHIYYRDHIDRYGNPFFTCGRGMEKVISPRPMIPLDVRKNYSEATFKTYREAVRELKNFANVKKTNDTIFIRGDNATTWVGLFKNDAWNK